MAKTEKRYLVDWTSWSEAKAAAEAQGWTEADSVLDFIEADDFSYRMVFPTFGAAVSFAAAVRPQDMWNCPRIRRQLLVNDRDDLGNRFRSKSWEEDAMWEVAKDDTPVEASPAQTFDLAA